MDDGQEEGLAVGGEEYGRRGEEHVSADSASQRRDTEVLGFRQRARQGAGTEKPHEQGKVDVLRSGDPLMLFEQRVHRTFWR